MVVEAKDSYDVMLLPGDGIGPEITAATVNALEPLQSLFKLNFKEVGGWLLTITITRAFLCYRCMLAVRLVHACLCPMRLSNRLTRMRRFFCEFVIVEGADRRRRHRRRGLAVAGLDHEVGEGGVTLQELSSLSLPPLLIGELVVGVYQWSIL